MTQLKVPKRFAVPKAVPQMMWLVLLAVVFPSETLLGSSESQKVSPDKLFLATAAGATTLVEG